MLECHTRKHKTKEYAVITQDGKEYNYLNESIKVATCNQCKTILLQHNYDNNGESVQRLYRGKKAKRLLHKIIQKTELYNSKLVDYRPYLLYNEYGKENKKCYSNLSSIKLGKETTYQGLNKINSVA